MPGETFGRGRGGVHPPDRRGNGPRLPSVRPMPATTGRSLRFGNLSSLPSVVPPHSGEDRRSVPAQGVVHLGQGHGRPSFVPSPVSGSSVTEKEGVIIVLRPLSLGVTFLLWGTFLLVEGHELGKYPAVLPGVGHCVQATQLGFQACFPPIEGVGLIRTQDLLGEALVEFSGELVGFDYEPGEEIAFG